MVKCRRRKVEMSAFPQSPWHREDCEIGPERSRHSPHHRARSHRGLVPSRPRFSMRRKAALTASRTFRLCRIGHFHFATTQMVKWPPCTGPHSSRGDEGKRHVNSKPLPLQSRESQGYTVSYSGERGGLITRPAKGKPGGGVHANAMSSPNAVRVWWGCFRCNQALPALETRVFATTTAAAR
jgi:hypothetical protein